MNDAHDPRSPQDEAPAPGGPQPAAPDDDERLATLRRVERCVGEIRGLLEATARARRQGDFSLARLTAAVLQMLAAAFVIVALADWTFDAPAVNQLIKLMFAGVFQLGALTAFILAREPR